ncbi:MAG: hypothetical protein E7E34_13275 [Staphylococcus epidermidis]|nr:hypothetical protein [Staphylococcus epidermidis]
MIPVGHDTYLMDTPGFSSLYTNDFGKEELKYYFPKEQQNNQIFLFQLQDRVQHLVHLKYKLKLS